MYLKFKYKHFTGLEYHYYFVVFSLSIWWAYFFKTWITSCLNFFSWLRSISLRENLREQTVQENCFATPHSYRRCRSRVYCTEYWRPQRGHRKGGGTATNTHSHFIHTKTNYVNTKKQANENFIVSKNVNLFCFVQLYLVKELELDRNIRPQEPPKYTNDLNKDSDCK